MLQLTKFRISSSSFGGMCFLAVVAVGGSGVEAAVGGLGSIDSLILLC